MKRSKFLAALRRRLWRDRKGATAVFFATMIPGLIGMAGLTVDVGRTFAAKRALTASAQSAALAGAYALQSNSAASAAQTAASTWASANPPANVTLSSTVASTSCNTSTGGLPSCSGSSPNVVSVTQTGTVSTFFLGAFGRSSFTLTSTASAAKSGGTAQPLNIMFVLDATGSMGDSDGGCGTVPNISSPTRWQCALYSIQSVLKVLPTSAANVGLMIFPGMGTQYSPTAHPCGSQPSSVAYYTNNIKYQIGTALDHTYNDGSGALVTTSPMIQYVGKYTTSSTTTVSPCVTNKGGQGSYGAEAIAKAQAALPTNDHRQNVIIFLSDGEFNSSDFASGNSSKATDQCKAAVTAATSAAGANTTVYSVAYGALTSNSASSGCYKDTGYLPALTPCTTMQGIASDSTKFYTTNANCKINGTAPSVTQLPAIFAAIKDNLATLTKPRLIAN
jgi:Flp pilus assembly protein TadG